jgi:hypothetical protein
MYTIGDVIYGCPLTNELADRIETALSKLPNAEDFDIGDPESYGFNQEYSGSGFFPVGIWFGVEVSGFDECANVCLDDLLREIPSADDLDEKYQAALENLEKCIRPLLPRPQLWIIWSTS